VQVLPEFQGAGRAAVDGDVAADEHAVAAKLEETRPVAVPTSLEPDGSEAVSVVEASGDDKQRVQFRAVLEAMSPEKVIQLRIALRGKVLRQQA